MNMMSLDFKEEINQIQETLQRVTDTAVVKKARGKDGLKIKELLQLMKLQLAMLCGHADKVKIAIDARDTTIHHLGEKLMKLRSRDAEPFYCRRSSDETKKDPTKAAESKKDPGLAYRPGEKITIEKRQSLEDELYMQMARLSMTMGRNALGFDEDELEEKIKEVAEAMKKEAKNESTMRLKTLELITESRTKNIERSKTELFLKSKNVPPKLIQECFAELEDRESADLSFDGSAEDDEFESEESMTPSVSTNSIAKFTPSEADFKFDFNLTPRDSPRKSVYTL